MKYLLILALLFTPAYAEFQDTQKQFIDLNSITNLLKNPGFEYGKQTWNLVSPASTFNISTNASTAGYGGASGSFAGGKSEALDSDLYQIPPMLLGKECAAQIGHQFSTGQAGDYQLKVLNHAGTEIATMNLLNSTIWGNTSLPFTCPATNGASIKLRVTGNSERGPQTIFLDQAYLGGLGTGPGVTYNSSTTNMRIEAARLNNSGASTCKIISQQGKWLDTAVAQTTGQCAYAISPKIFKNVPVCTCTFITDSGSGVCEMVAASTGVTTNELSLNITTKNGGSAADIADLNVICIGERAR